MEACSTAPGASFQLNQIAKSADPPDGIGPPVIDFSKTTPKVVQEFAAAHGFEAYTAAGLNEEAWQGYLDTTDRGSWPPWLTLSKVTIVPFYDRTGLIAETLGTLEEALRRIPEIRAEFWQDLAVPGTGADLNQTLEKAGRVADFLEFGELFRREFTYQYKFRGPVVYAILSF